MKMTSEEATEYVKMLEEKYKDITNKGTGRILDEFGRITGFDFEAGKQNLQDQDSIRVMYNDFICVYFEIEDYPKDIKEIIVGMGYVQNELDNSIFEDHFWNLQEKVPEIKRIIKWAETRNDKK